MPGRACSSACAYLKALVARHDARPRRRAAQQVRPQLQRVLDNLVDTAAIVSGRRTDILAWNPLAAALLIDFAQVPPRRRNYIRLLFTHPELRERFPDWENDARVTVSFLRMEAAANPDDPDLTTTLVGELSVQDTHFRQWWAERHVAQRRGGTKTIRHPVAVDLTLDWDTLTLPDNPDQQLIIWTAEPGSPSHQAMRILVSWSAADPQNQPSEGP